MNQGRIWCVVNPTVGLPLFLGSVAVTSLIVHASVLTNTTWFSGYWAGHSKAKTAEVINTGTTVVGATGNTPGFVLSVAPVVGKAPGATTFVVSVSPQGAEVAAATSDVTLAQAGSRETP
jgi:light-harvesting protein B-800-850 alpha chain